MAIKCPKCGAEFDVTLFTFGRAIQCDCGEWVDLTTGHQQTTGEEDQAAADDEEYHSFLDYLNDRFCGFTGS